MCSRLLQIHPSGRRKLSLKRVDLPVQHIRYIGPPVVGAVSVHHTDKNSQAAARRCPEISPSNVEIVQAECDVYQTPTSQAVREAEADVGDLHDKGRATSFISSLTSRMSRAASFYASHSDLQKLDTSAAPRARLLAFSRSQPDLKATASAGAPPPGLVVLGKEGRRRSRRFVQSEDGTLAAHHPGLSASNSYVYV